MHEVVRTNDFMNIDVCVPRNKPKQTQYYSNIKGMKLFVTNLSTRVITRLLSIATKEAFEKQQESYM